MKKLFTMLMCAIALLANAEIVTNATIIELLKKGYNTEIIQGLIDGADDCQLTADIASIDALLEAGADSDLITYIQRKVKKEYGAVEGLYWWNTGGKPQKLNIVALSQESKGLGGGIMAAAVNIAGTAVGLNRGSLGTIAGSWIASDVIASAGFKSDKLIIKGEHAHLQVNNSTPVFRFVIPDASTVAEKSIAEQWYYRWMSGIQSPNEFQLIRLQSKGKGNKAKRAFPTGLKWGVMGFSKNEQDAGQDIVEFDVTQISNRVYEVSFPNGLEPGEYAFFYRNALHSDLKEHLSAFDFTVTE